jgi:tetratricopeptide (TPR) repeat protein
MHIMKQRARSMAMVCISLIATALRAQQPASQSAAGATPPTAIQQALQDLKQHQPQKALDLLKQAIAANPDDAPANLLAATTAIELENPALAVSYGERARALEPTNWKVDTTLVTAYAMAGKTRERDAERAALHTLHDAGTQADAKQTSGFLLDRFKVKRYTVDAVEYFAPVGKFHIYYCFFIRNSQGLRVWQINAQSDDFNQASWAKAYPQQAADGQRQYQLTGEGNGVRSDYRSFSGSANYDWIKARVIEILNAQAAPFPGEPAEPNS